MSLAVGASDSASSGSGWAEMQVLVFWLLRRSRRRGWLWALSSHVQREEEGKNRAAAREALDERVCLHCTI